MAESQRLNLISKPHAHDVLSGRGNLVNRHPGNEHFRSLVKRYKEEYVACPKSQKAMYSKLIYDEIRSLDPPGRFLKQDPNTKLWDDIGKKLALAKTRQALREGAPELLRDLQTFEQFCLHSTSESNLAQGANVTSGGPNDYASIEPNNQIDPILSRFVRQSSSPQSIGSESVLSLDSTNNGKKNNATQLSAIVHNEASTRFTEVPSYATFMAASSESGDGTRALLQLDSASRMQSADRPSNPWQIMSNTPGMLHNFSTRGPEHNLHVAVSNTVNGINQQRVFTEGVNRNSTNQFTNINYSQNVPCLSTNATSHQQQCNIINDIFGNNNASINNFTNRTNTENASFVDSAPSSHQNQCNVINNTSLNHTAPTNQFAISTGINNAPLVNFAASSHQQHCNMTNNISRNENPNCLLPLLASLNPNNSDASNTRTDTQLLHYQLAYQHLLSKWDSQQNNVSEGGDQTACTPFQNSRAKSA